MTPPKLIMTFEANTIKHLGIKMYSTMPPALAELIANAYDACATEVQIKLYDDGNKKIIVEDNGSGMLFDEINNHFLKIGRNRREENQKSDCGRTPTGKKGLGKLALFGIGDTITIITKKADSKSRIRFVLDWNEIMTHRGSDYTPQFKIETDLSSFHGTKIILTNLKRKTQYNLDSYAESLASFFDFTGDFKIFLSLNENPPIEIDNKSKYENINPQFSWDISEVIQKNEQDYEEKTNIRGQIYTTEKPLKPSQRGITLFANGRLVNQPEFFGPSESSYFYSYTTGWINVDFIDNWEEDVISTNRQSIDWDNDKTIALREYLASCIAIVASEWREKRKKKKEDDISINTGIDIDNWFSTLPGEVKDRIESFISILNNNPELSQEIQQKSVKIIHDLVPEYPNLHWRGLEKEIKNVSQVYYENGDYYSAFIEALKKYVYEVRKKSGSTNSSDRSLMGEVFNKRKLSVTKKYKRTDGSDFYPDTIKNIEEGQADLSQGIVTGGRNPIQHEEHKELSLTGLFTEKDCLDFLSLLSHLYKRLEDSEVP